MHLPPHWQRRSRLPLLLTVVLTLAVGAVRGPASAAASERQVAVEQLLEWPPLGIGEVPRGPEPGTDPPAGHVSLRLRGPGDGSFSILERNLRIAG